MASRQISQVLLGPEAPAEGSSCFRVRPLLARCARSPGVFLSAAVLPAVFRCFLERLTPPGAHSKAFWPPGCLPGASWGPLGRHPGAQEPPRAPQKRPESPPRAAKSAPRAPQETPSSPKPLGALFLIDLGAPSGSILGALEPQKTVKSVVLSSKIKVFAVLRAVPEKDQTMSQFWPPARPKTCPERKRKAESQEAVVATVCPVVCCVCLVVPR